MITIIGWKKFQHYAQRNPPWIKLHTGLQDKPEFRNMSAQARALLMDLWLLAAKEKIGVIVKDVQTIAWELREIEIETCLALKEISEVRDCDGNFQWVEWEVTGIDAVLLAQCERSASTLQASHTQHASKSVSEPLIDIVDDSVSLEDRSSLPPPQMDLASETLADEPEEVAEKDKKPMPKAHVTDETFEPEPETETWLTPYARPYEKRMGKGSFPYGRAAKAMKKLEMIHGKPEVQLRWALCCEQEQDEYLNPQTFAEKFNTWSPAKQELSSLTPQEHLEAG